MRHWATRYILLSIIMPCLLSQHFGRAERSCLEWSVTNGSNVVQVSESTKVGTEVYRIDGADVTFDKIHIKSGNTDNRFSASHSGVIYLKGYLDYDIINKYELLIIWENATHSEDEVCMYYNLTVNVIDDSGWPIYFNESCCLCPTDVIRMASNPYPLQLYVTSDEKPIQNTGVNLWGPDDVFWDPYYAIKCEGNLYFDTYDKVMPPVFSDHGKSYTPLLCSVNNTQIEVVRLYIYMLEDLPERLQNMEWFKHKRGQDKPILKLVFDFEKTLNIIVGKPVYCGFQIPKTKLVLGELMKLEVVGCPKGKYGLVCENDCICQNGAVCHALTGACQCQDGWDGPACDIPKKMVVLTPKYQEVFYGEYVYLSCKFYGFRTRNFQWLVNGSPSHNNSDLHIYDSPNGDGTGLIVMKMASEYAGTYECIAFDDDGNNYTDSAMLLLKGCPPGFYGANCTMPCNCENGAVCDRYYGCVCTAGWTGKYCNQDCPSDKYGADCSESCQCKNGANCDRMDGSCTCANDLTCGDLCQIKCDCPSGETHQCNETLQTCFCFKTTQGPSKSFLFSMIGGTTGVLAALVLISIRVAVHRKNRWQRILDNEFDDMIKGLSPMINDWKINSSQIKLKGSVIGVGEFGKVELADFNSRSGTTTVAVKSVLSGKSTSVTYRDFCHEIRCLIQLQGHCNIIKLYGVVTSGDPKYIVVEYAFRGDLLNFVRNLKTQQITVTDEATLVKISRDVSCALQYMENHKFVHRDLACRNILITSDHVAKIGDFGLSRDVYETGQYCKAPWDEGQGPLPLKWMPLEFLQEGQFNTKSEVWSFGVVLWEIISLGEIPFENVSAYVLIRILQEGKRLARPDNCSNQAYLLMKRCWESNGESRPSPSEITNALDKLLSMEKKFFNYVKPDNFIEDFNNSNIAQESLA